MNSTIAILLIFVAIFVIGLSSIYLNYRGLIKRRDFINQFGQKFIQFVKHDGFDAETYVWLTMNAIEAQKELGVYGLFEYKLPGTYKPTANYEIIINVLPYLRKGKLSEFGLTSSDREDVSTSSEAIIRYQGVLENRIKKTTDNLRNPVIWFREGVQQIILTPVCLLTWFGLIGQNKVADIQNFCIFQVISGFLALISFVSGIITIVVGWEQFVKFILGVWGLIFK